MGWFDWFVKSKAPKATLTEAVAASPRIDDDDENYRRLTGNSLRELPQITTERARQIATHLWDTNLLANRIVELPLAFLLAEGVQIECSDEAAQAIINAHWHDPINRWNSKLMMYCRDLSLSGEQCWPVFVSQAGFVRCGYLDPEMIEDTVCDPDNPSEIIGVRTKPDVGGKQHTYRTIYAGDDAELFGERAQALRKAMRGDCIYVAINRIPSRRRGKSDLLAAADWLDGYDDFLFNEFDRSEKLRAFVWDVTLKGADQTKVDEFSKSTPAPAPGSVNVHNDSVEWKALSPTLNAVETKETARLFRNHALGGASIPEHWFGSAEDVNKSTGDSMAMPTLKVLTARQRELTEVLVLLCRFVLFKAGVFDPGIHASIKIKWPDLESKDVSRFAAAMQQVTAAMSQAVQGNLITEETGLKVMATICRMLGVEVDIAKELADTLAAKDVAQENDAFVPAPDDVPFARD